MRCTSVVIADRHPVVLQGLTSVLGAESGFKVVASCSDGTNCIQAIRSGLSIPRAHLVGSSMGGYAALQFALRHPEKASAVVAVGTGLGSLPLEYQAWLKRTAARAITARGMKAMASKMAHHQTRIGLKHKDPKGWQEYLSRLEQHSSIGMANTWVRFQALRPSLFEFSDEFSRMAIPVLLSVGDHDASCLEAALMLKSLLPNAGLWVAANTGHSVNLEEPSHFNALEDFFSAVERGSRRRVSRRLYYFRENSITDAPACNFI